MVADCHSILDRWMYYFSQLLHAHGVNDVKQTEIHTAERLVYETSASDFELAVENLKSRKSPVIDQIPAEFKHFSLIQLMHTITKSQEC